MQASFDFSLGVGFKVNQKNEIAINLYMPYLLNNIKGINFEHQFRMQNYKNSNLKLINELCFNTKPMIYNESSYALPGENFFYKKFVLNYGLGLRYNYLISLDYSLGFQMLGCINYSFVDDSYTNELNSNHTKKKYTDNTIFEGFKLQLSLTKYF